MRRALIFPVVALVALAGLAGCTGGSGSAGSSAGSTLVRYAPADRAAAPAITGELLDGTAYDSGSTHGKVTVINFWASWCAPCRAEAADLEQTYQATRAAGVAFLGINIRDDRDKAKAFAFGRATYPSLFDPAGRLAVRFNVPPNTIPETLILDRSGRVAVVIRKPTRQPELEPIVAQLAAEGPGAG